MARNVWLSLPPEIAEKISRYIADEYPGISLRIKNMLRDEAQDDRIPLYRKAALKCVSDELLVDSDAAVSVSEEADGAHVMAWVWINEGDLKR